jgi:hypothetical protein
MKTQKSNRPKQLTLFLFSLWLLCSCAQSEVERYFGKNRLLDCYEKPANDPCYKEPQPTRTGVAHHWCESSPDPAKCYANQGAIQAPCTAKREMEFQKCLDEEGR